MNREHIQLVNWNIFREQGECLGRLADPQCKVLVVANPTNTNCLVLQESAPQLHSSNFTALSRLDLNRTKQCLA
jgi:malate/lactate dehydrogenase